MRHGDNRTSGRLTVASLPLVAALLVAMGTQSASAERPPNIVLILADDLGWRDTGCYGSSFYETPCIDALARRGMRFTDAYAASPLCSPTRASILTGQYPARLRLTMPACHLPRETLDPIVPATGSPHQRAVTPETRTRLPLEYITVAEVLRDQGYRTGFFGKWHLGRDPYLPEQQGFDVVVGGREHPGPPPPGHFFAPWNCDTLPSRPEGTHICDALVDEAIGFLGDNRHEPFFMCLWFYDVHAPFQAKERLKAKYAAKADPTQPQHCPTMGGMIEVMDRNVGRFIEAMANAGLTENTIVIFTSDNGGNMYNEVDGTTPTNNAPLRSGKGNNYEGGVRVPLIVVWPGHVAAGSKCDAAVTSVDYFPTLLELTGAAPPAGQVLDGVSLLPLLEGSDAPQREAIFSHFPHYVPATENIPNTSVRAGPWKLYRFFCDGPEQTVRHELYRLDDDIGESNDLSGRMPRKVRDLDRRIDDFLAQTAALVPAPNPRYRPRVDGWAGNDWAEIHPESGALVLQSVGDDPFVTITDLEPIAGPLTVHLRMRSSSRGGGRLFWSTPQRPGFHRGVSVDFRVTHDEAWHDYVIPIDKEIVIDGLRLDPCTAPGRVAIDAIRLEDDRGETLRAWTFE